MSERYVIRKKIADGGMAEIFLASQLGAEGFERPVVLKRILPEFSGHAQFRNMLVDEAHIAMSLNHTNIVPVLDLGHSNGLYFLAMELVDGWDLSTILERARGAALALPPGLALYITAEVCRGLAYAHGRKRSDGRPMGIIHRDISPQNVLVSEQGEVKVTDFGIAQAFVKRDRTQVGIIKGKLEFMSPEQAGGAPLGAASDIFSVGTMLYMLTSGQRPFYGPTDHETFLKIRKATCQPLEEANPNLTPEVVAIVKRAMQPPPSQRYASADEMMADLEEVIRLDFGSAGRSELKRWLAELSKRDGAPPISGRPGLPMKAGQGALELGDNSVITLKDAVPDPTPERTEVFDGPLEELDDPPPLQLAPTPPPEADGTPPPVVPIPEYPPPRRGLGALRVSLALAIVAAGGAVASTHLLGNRERIGPATDRHAAVTSAETGAVGSRQDAPPADELVPKHPEPTRVARKTAGSHDRVTLRLVTRPAGARVFDHRGERGHTPLWYPAQIGNTASLVFKKPGYAPVRRRVVVDPKHTTVVVELVRRGTASPRQGLTVSPRQRRTTSAAAR
jgi:serine/threonine protein kinase